MSCWQAPTPPLPEHMLRVVEEEEEEEGGGDRQSREHRCGSQLQCFTVNHTISDICLFLWTKNQLKNSFSRILGFTSSSQTCSMPHSQCRETDKLKQMDSGRTFDHHCFTLIRVSLKFQGRSFAQSGSNPLLLYSNFSMFSGSKVSRLSGQSLGVIY